MCAGGTRGGWPPPGTNIPHPAWERHAGRKKVVVKEKSRGENGKKKSWWKWKKKVVVKMEKKSRGWKKKSRGWKKKVVVKMEKKSRKDDAW
jgi:hypothetical protein